MLWSLQATAQISDFERVDPERPEGWALRYAGAVTQYSGVTPPSATSGQSWTLGLEAAYVPTISEADTRVGFDGRKFEDLNKAPYFGRVRLSREIGPINASVAWTPPLTIEGVKAKNLLSGSVGSAVWSSARTRLTVTAFAQRGSVEGDFTCSEENVAAGPGNIALNPFACRSPSSDVIDLDYYGAEVALARRLGDRWEVWLAHSRTRLDATAHIEAEVFDTVDLSVVTTKDTLQGYSLGVSRQFDEATASLTLSHTPLSVRRPPEREREGDDLTTVRISLAFPFGNP